MVSVFWDVHGILSMNYLEKDETINSEYYTPLLDQLSEEIKEKWPHVRRKKVLFHQDSAPCPKSEKTIVKLNELHFELLPYPPYSPDLSHRDYWHFADAKKVRQEKKFGRNEEVVFENEAYFESKDKSFFKNDIEKLDER
nr:histone-lysine N-methyltransferase SETMAR-like [Parasteatoda tepidariorum]